MRTPLKKQSLAVVAQAFNPSTLGAEADGSLEVQRQPDLQSGFQVSQSYTEKLFLEKTKNQTNTSKNWRESSDARDQGQGGWGLSLF